MYHYDNGYDNNEYDGPYYDEDRREDIFEDYTGPDKPIKQRIQDLFKRNRLNRDKRPLINIILQEGPLMACDSFCDKYHVNWLFPVKYRYNWPLYNFLVWYEKYKRKYRENIFICLGKAIWFSLIDVDGRWKNRNNK